MVLISKTGGDKKNRESNVGVTRAVKSITTLTRRPMGCMRCNLVSGTRAASSLPRSFTSPGILTAAGWLSYNCMPVSSYDLL